MGQAKRDVPRWKRNRNRNRTPPGQVVLVRGRGREANELRRQIRNLPAAYQGTQAPVPMARGPIAATGAFRFRYQLAPLGWLALIAAGAGCHYAKSAALAVIMAVLQWAVTLAFTRHRKGFTRICVRSSSTVTLLWMTVLGFTGLARPWGWLALVSWAVPAALWVNHYHWRPAKAEVISKRRDATPEETFAELAARRKWQAWLGPSRPIEGGTQHDIVCRGAHTNIDEIVGMPSAIAAAFDKPVTEAYAEPREDGVKSRGQFTLLKTSTLDTPRPWDRAGIDQRTGLAVVGRFPDGKPVRERYFNLPRDGVKHTIVAGADGSGKTGLLDMGLAISARSGIVAPVILDPQMGQALPAWRDHVPYACGPDECMTYLRGLHAAMMARSEYLGQLRWRDDKGRMRTGMGFFNPYLCGLPVIEITIDEAPVLLRIPKPSKTQMSAVAMIMDIGKLGRKAGFRLRLAAQVPSLAELQAQELRSMLVGGNVFCLRTGDKVTGGMMNIKANPYELPKNFRGGAPTHGLGYADTIDARASTPMRADWVDDPYEEADRAADEGMIRPPDDSVAECLARAIAAGDADLDQLVEMADAASRVQMDVLRQLDGKMTRGEIISACLGAYADGQYKLSEITTAIRELGDSGKIRSNPDGTFQVVR